MLLLYTIFKWQVVRSEYNKHFVESGKLAVTEKKK